MLTWDWTINILNTVADSSAWGTRFWKTPLDWNSIIITTSGGDTYTQKLQLNYIYVL
jgi:hypothetical protein